MWFQRQAFIRMLHPSMYVFKKVFILKIFEESKEKFIEKVLVKNLFLQIRQIVVVDPSTLIWYLIEHVCPVVPYHP